MAEFRMPSLGSDMEDGTLIEWEKQPGDVVHRGDVIAVIETQKGAIEIEVYEDGVLENVLVNLGDRVPVGTPLAMIGDGSGNLATVPDVENRVMATAHIPKTHIVEPVAATSITVNEHTDTDRLRVTPAARQLASESNIDLASLVGSGPGFAIVLDDVRQAITSNSLPETTPTKKSASQLSKERKGAIVNPRLNTSSMNGMRAAIATAMSRSKREIPHYYLSHTVQADKLTAYIAEINSQRAPEARLVSGAAYIRAVALAVKKYPEFNGHFENDLFAASDAIHIGMAINIRGGGLVAPAIHHADTIGLDDAMVKLKDLVERVRKGRFRAAELSDPTLTISSLGDRGVDSLYGVIYPPQVAIIGIGTPVSTVQMEDGNIVPAHSITITLAADHRVSDGHRGSLFLRAITHYLQNPEELK